MPALERRRCKIADAEIDPRPHDLMWIDDAGEARHISDKVMRTVTLGEVVLFLEWADKAGRVGVFAAPPRTSN